MKVLLLLPYAWDTSPGQRFRIEQWAPHLKDLGIEFEIDELMTFDQQKFLYSKASPARKAAMILRTSYDRWRRISASARRADVVWLHRTLTVIGPAWLERRLARLGVPILYEFDDAIWVTDTTKANRAFGWLKFAGKTEEICRLSHTVVVGNKYLADFAARHNPRVEIVPTTIDTHLYQPKSSYDISGRTVIGWSGSITTSHHLELIGKALETVSKRHEILFKVLGDKNFDLPGVTTEASDWNRDTEVGDISGFDIGLMPLHDNQWAKGKCGLKALQYMGMGIPTILSPVGVNADIIRNGENGLWATTEDEWVSALTRLIESKELRERLGRAGRATVESDFSAVSQTPRVHQILQNVAASKA
jgi:glycosyltransferase involved in cell wall biosynthesis